MNLPNIHGVIPPMLTPFNADESIDESAFRAEIRYMLDEAGVHGLGVSGSTGEGYTLTREEMVRVTEIAVEEAAGKVPVISGIIVDSTREAIARARLVAGLGIAALQVTNVHYIFAPDDESIFRHFAAIADAVDVPVLIYNVVPWAYCSRDVLVRCINEIPGVVGVKQSAQDLKLLADIIGPLRGKGLVFSAVDALLYPSFLLGAQGTISAMGTAAPGLCVRLWDAVRGGDHATAEDIHDKLLRIWNAIAGGNLPACIKAGNALQGRPAGRPRAPMPPASEKQQATIREALAVAGMM